MHSASYSPWEWVPGQESWFAWLGARLKSWNPHTELDIDKASLRTVLTSASHDRAPWLIHPCATAITLEDPADKLHRDARLAFWTASNAPEFSGKIHLPVPVWIWNEEGGRQVPQGIHELPSCPRRPGKTISLDVWCNSLGTALRDSWAQLSELSQAMEQQLRHDVVTFFSAINWLETKAPAIFTWLTCVTKVAIPLYHADSASDEFHSLSSPDLPGLIQLDLFGGQLQVLEALVHESAHRHLYFAEAAGDLVDPLNDDKYKSPLRSDPRPLRGILLACHALAYICCLYREVQSRGEKAAAAVRGELSKLERALADCESTLRSNRHSLTLAGSAFLDHTLSVSTYAR